MEPGFRLSRAVGRLLLRLHECLNHRLGGQRAWRSLLRVTKHGSDHIAQHILPSQLADRANKLRFDSTSE